MNLSSIFKRYLSGRETGQLVVKFDDVEHLCKISIENGNAVFIALGTLGPRETLDFIANKRASQANFIPGVPPRKKLDESLNEELLSLAGGQAAGTPAPSATSPAKAAGGIPPQKIEAVIDDFVDIVGPLGTVIAQNAISRLGYSKGSPMDGENFSAFLMALQDEVPDEEKSQFLTRHMNK